jgi:hypothetical protein
MGKSFPPFFSFSLELKQGLSKLSGGIYGGCCSHRNCVFAFFLSPKRISPKRISGNLEASANPQLFTRQLKRKLPLERYFIQLSSSLKGTINKFDFIMIKTLKRLD